jgi:hypothetical protein
MGNYCISKARIDPIYKTNVIINIERSFRNSGQSYQENIKPSNLRFRDNNIFYSNQNSINEAEIVVTDSYKSDEVKQYHNLRTRRLESKEFAELLRDDIQKFNECADYFENITRELIKAKICIDNCTYDESHHRFCYSVVPLSDIFTL